MKRCNGEISYVEDRTVEFISVVDENGNVKPLTSYPDVLESHDSSLWCSECSRLGADEYEAHGISEDWEVV